MSNKKTVLITGATRGIGKGIALAFADAGYHVYGTGRNLSGSEWATQKKIHLKEADVTDPARMSEIMTEIKATHGALDCLINNAGIASNSPASALTQEEIQNIIAVNFKGVFECCQSYYKLQRKAGGNIINVSSVLGIVGTSLASVYSGTKGAVIAMTRALAIEWAGSGFRVNAICPGFIDTDMTEMIKKRENLMKKLIDVIPQKRLGTPVDIAGPTLFLASDAAGYMTGQRSSSMAE